jgi:acyl-lipid omega-6 desaturase (Delta-12 desaturase)
MYGAAQIAGALPVYESPAHLRPHSRCLITSPIQLLKEQKAALIRQHTQPDDSKGLTQVLTTLIALVALWWLALASIPVSRWLTASIVVAICFFTLRVFALMHECGHDSLFRSARLNRGFGFILGVVAGMPQYVWSKNHHFHHTHNGNWERYRGPYTTMSIDEYASLTDTQQYLYRLKCSLGLAPLVGFIYLIFNPRYTWLRGSVGLVRHLVRNKFAQPAVPLKTHFASFKTRYWKSEKEFWHMTWNNVVLLSIWAVMCLLVGPAVFFTLYVISVSLAGGGGIVLFTVQHNFEHAYASDSEHWDYDSGALNGTSFLRLPGFLNYFTAHIGYHHIHHLSPKIPNYCLVECHNSYEHLFADVRRLQLSDVQNSLKCILWDSRAQRIITVAEYRGQLVGATQ